jgi:hypothetical protein
VGGAHSAALGVHRVWLGAALRASTKCVPVPPTLALRSRLQALTPCARVPSAISDAGANPDQQNSWGSTPLHYACYGNHLECVRTLAGRGASTQIVDSYGRTPKDDAEQRGHTAVVELLAAGGPEDDLIGFDSSLEVTEGGVAIPPPAATPAGTTWQREKWQEATRKVRQMHAGVTAFRETVEEKRPRPLDPLEPPPPAAEPKTAAEITADQAEAAKERGNEAMKANKFNQAVRDSVKMRTAIAQLSRVLFGDGWC